MGEGVTDTDIFLDPGREVVDKRFKLAHNCLSHGTQKGCRRYSRHRHHGMPYLGCKWECAADTDTPV